jgi:hypothetical protein
MPNYDPTVLAQMLRMKTGSAMTPAEMATMQAQQQMAQQQMRQQAGAAMTPAEMQYYQQMQGR